MRSATELRATAPFARRVAAQILVVTACLRVSLILATCLLVLAPRIAVAGGPRGEPEIQWSAPPECARLVELRAEIDRLLTRSQRTSSRPIRASVKVTRDAGRYRLKLRITDRDGHAGERRIQGETCAEVTDAAAVIIALAIDVEPPPLDDPDAPWPDEAPPSAPDAPRKSAATAPLEGSRSLRIAWDVSAIAGVDVASLPAPTSGLGASVALAVGANRLELRAVGWLPRRATLAGQPTVGGDVSLFALGLRFCRSLRRGMIELSPCVGVEGGALPASSVGVDPPASGVGRWLAPELGFRTTLHAAPRFGMSIELDGLVPVFRDRFVIARGGEVYRPPAATARAVMGLHLRFP